MKRLPTAGLVFGLLAACGGVALDLPTDKARGKAESTQIRLDGEPIEVRDGDIVFYASPSSQHVALRTLMNSIYTHMGLVLIRDGLAMVLEANKGVQWTELRRWIARGRDGRVVIKRLKEDKLLDADALAKLQRYADRLYDAGYGYNRQFRWAWEKEQALYCSQLVYVTYEQIGLKLGKLETFGQLLKRFDGDYPQEITDLAERLYPGGITYVEDELSQESVITPRSILEDHRLVQTHPPTQPQ